jgi:heterodisulfide reductase subunit B
LSYAGKVRIRHPLDVFKNDIGIKKLSAQVKRPLQGLKVACYYGCQLVRPYAEFDDQHAPSSMDELLKACGAETIEWPLKTRCCGGALTGTIEEVGMRLSYILLTEAKKRGCNVIATACPLCQFNLECYQRKMSKAFGGELNVPVAFFTQLLGYALGSAENKLGLKRLFVPLAISQIATASAGGAYVRS